MSRFAKLAAAFPQKGPARVLMWSMLGRSVASGVLLTVVVLFFTRSVGLSADALGLGLVIAAVLKIVVSVLAGKATDLMGCKRAAILFVVLQGVLVFTYVLADNFVGFVITSSLVGMAQSGAEAARGALIAGVIPAEERVRTRSYMKSVNNIGISLGALLGGVALEFNTRFVYVTLLVACGVLLIIGGLVYLALPAARTMVRPHNRPRWEVLRDRPYMTFGLINAVLTLNTGILEVALPLWIAQRTSAPADPIDITTAGR